MVLSVIWRLLISLLIIIIGSCVNTADVNPIGDCFDFPTLGHSKTVEATAGNRLYIHFGLKPSCTQCKTGCTIYITPPLPNAQEFCIFRIKAVETCKSLINQNRDCACYGYGASVKFYFHKKITIRDNGMWTWRFENRFAENISTVMFRVNEPAGTDATPTTVAHHSPATNTADYTTTLTNSEVKTTSRIINFDDVPRSPGTGMPDGDVTRVGDPESCRVTENTKGETGTMTFFLRKEVDMTALDFYFTFRRQSNMYMDLLTCHGSDLAVGAPCPSIEKDYEARPSLEDRSVTVLIHNLTVNHSDIYIMYPYFNSHREGRIECNFTVTLTKVSVLPVSDGKGRDNSVVITAVCVALALGIVVVVAVILWKHRQPKEVRQTICFRQPTRRDLHQHAPRTDNEEIGEEHEYLEILDDDGYEVPYSVLRASDIGLRSEYTPIRRNTDDSFL